jgi:hypothetical protein
VTLPPRLARWEALVTPIALNYRVDPVLVLAILDRESLGGDALTPKGPEGTGDGGHGKGLGQIDDRSHPFATCQDDTGHLLWQDPWLNVSYACRLLRRLLDTFHGETAPALAAYNAGAGRVSRVLASLPVTAPPAQRLAAVDAVTTGKDYASAVLAKRDAYTGGVRSA